MFLKGMQTHTHTHLNICVSMKALMGHTYVPIQTHTQTLYPALTSQRRETNTQAHIILLISGRGKRGKQVHGGRQTDSVSDPPSLVYYYVWFFTISLSLPQNCKQIRKNHNRENSSLYIPRMGTYCIAWEYLVL